MGRRRNDDDDVREEMTMMRRRRRKRRGIGGRIHIPPCRRSVERCGVDNHSNSSRLESRAGPNDENQSCSFLFCYLPPWHEGAKRGPTMKTPQRKETGYRQIAMMLRCASEEVEGDAGSMMGSIFVSTEYIYNQIFSPGGEIL